MPILQQLILKLLKDDAQQGTLLHRLVNQCLDLGLVLQLNGLRRQLVKQLKNFEVVQKGHCLFGFVSFKHLVKFGAESLEADLLKEAFSNLLMLDGSQNGRV